MLFEGQAIQNCHQMSRGGRCSQDWCFNRWDEACSNSTEKKPTSGVRLNPSRDHCILFQQIEFQKEKANTTVSFLWGTNFCNWSSLNSIWIILILLGNLCHSHQFIFTHSGEQGAMNARKYSDKENRFQKAIVRVYSWLCAQYHHTWWVYLCVPFVLKYSIGIQAQSRLKMKVRSMALFL